MQSNDIKIISSGAQDCFGLKGSGAAKWLQEQNIQVPDAPNHWVQQNERHLLLRLGSDAFLLQAIDPQDQLQPDALIAKLELCLSIKPLESTGVYRVPHADSFLQLSGDGVADLLSQVCRLDTHHVLQNNALVISQIAGVNATLLKASSHPEVYYLWFDVSYQDYMVKTMMHLAKPAASMNNDH